jgi:hypothetical protein
MCGIYPGFASEGTYFRPRRFIVAKDYFAFELRVTFSLFPELRTRAILESSPHYKRKSGVSAKS